VSEYKGEKYYIGNHKLVEENQIVLETEMYEDWKVWSERGHSLVFLMNHHKVIAMMAFDDQIKNTAAMVVSSLRNEGIQVYMVTGDSQQAAEKVGNKVGISNIYAEVSPIEKRNLVASLRHQGYVVAFVGDGINDSPALAEADVGIAIGAGTDVALDSADIILVKNELNDVFTAIDLSRVIFNRIRINYLWACIYNLSAIPIAAGVLYPFGVTVPPMLAGLLMAFSSVSVVASSLMLTTYRKPSPRSTHSKRNQYVKLVPIKDLGFRSHPVSSMDEEGEPMLPLHIP